MKIPTAAAAFTEKEQAMRMIAIEIVYFRHWERIIFEISIKNSLKPFYKFY